MKRSITLLFALLLITGCASEKTESPDILTGWLTPDQLYTAFPEYQLEGQGYTAEDAVIAEMDALDDEFEVLIIIGTWCPDCKRELPRFLSAIERLENTSVQYKIYGLDRAKNDRSGMREKYDIEFIPTFIIYADGQEIGRIIETPMVSMEQDLLDIMTSANVE
ncbi:MAG: thioredoxin domain-containing protein [candidate division KSB1 bacterium]|jgi:thiol-disulfide isomerase/thioredoxin|nr:thioredoxin domain-containing protein [candidate division KSB1 bacterium]